MKKVQASLVDRFYRESEEMMVPQQYQAAKKDSEYFIKLVDRVFVFYRE
ncbi:MAG: hypothetical protein KKH85_09155 [Proteobacteria bacterium]|nr:hypothetical protein [Pseudomonadota bacterium]